MFIKGNSIQEVYKKLIEQLFLADEVGSTKEINNCCLEVKDPSIKDFYLFSKHL